MLYDASIFPVIAPVRNGEVTTFTSACNVVTTVVKFVDTFVWPNRAGNKDDGGE